MARILGIRNKLKDEAMPNIETANTVQGNEELSDRDRRQVVGDTRIVNKPGLAVQKTNNTTKGC